MDAPSDGELLAIQAEVAVDGRGRLAGVYGVTVVCAGDHCRALIGAKVPDDLVAALTAALHGGGRSGRVGPPPGLDECQRLLEAGGRSLRDNAGLVYVITEEARFASSARIERSDAPSGETLRDRNPGNWHAVEWDELLDGRLGPWAIAVEDEQVVSICHTARRMTARAAECGVWTRPGFRGRGHAAAVTSVWAEVLRPSGRHLFYSCDADNLSSQAVTRRLGLRPVGSTWSLAAPGDGEDEGLHPLSALRRRPQGDAERAAIDE